MALSQEEQMQIAEIVSTVLDAKLFEFRDELTEDFGHSIEILTAMLGEIFGERSAEMAMVALRQAREADRRQPEPVGFRR